MIMDPAIIAIGKARLKALVSTHMKSEMTRKCTMHGLKSIV